MAQPFHYLDIPISGTNLIEASAGTGKTYSIAALYTRLLLLEDYTVENILVVTFARAATAELKTRLRGYLEKARRLLDASADADSGDFLDDILPKAVEKAGSPAALVEKIKAILAEFDNASIYTLHGFCQRLLRDYAFLCEAPFDIELSNEPDPFLLQAAQDFWRQHIAVSPLNAALSIQHKAAPQKCLNAFQRYLKQPYLQTQRPDIAAADEYRRQAAPQWADLQPRLDGFRQHFAQLLPYLHQNRYRENTYAQLFDTLSAQPPHTLPESHRFPEYDAKDYENKILKLLGKLTADSLASCITKKHLEKNGSVPAALQTHIDALDKLGQYAEILAQLEHDNQSRFAAVQIELFEYLRAAVREHKKNHSRRDFDDLLIDTHYALTEGRHREQLAHAVTQQWRIGLIDEFQDTDAVQYAVFRRLFIEHKLPLFLVGDPKQAIYGFRGADIFTYLQAAQDADRHYTLTTNHRSSAGLVGGIHALFDRAAPFVLPQIAYPAVAAARSTANVTPSAPALQIRWLNRDDETAAPQTVLNPRAAAYCADEIAALLNQAAQGSLKHKDHPLQARQIAVLVRNHNQSNLVAHALQQRGIRSVRVQKKSVFDTPEAQALEQLLTFWLSPQNTRPLYFVLAGSLFGFTADELHNLQQNDAEQSRYIQAAETAHQTWLDRGIFTALQQFAAQYGMESRLLARGSERTLTNYHQLSELLAEAEECGTTPHALLKWLQQHIADSGRSSDSAQLRLESDENLVQIVTVHTSKGLQYPIVFCPFAWSGTAVSDNQWRTVRTDRDTLLLAPNQPLPPQYAQVLPEAQIALGEELRLLYVALTRAEDRLYLYAAEDKKTFKQSTFNYLLPDGAEDNNAEQRWQQWLSEAPSQNTDIVWHRGAPPTNRYTPPATATAADGETIVLRRGFRRIQYTSFTGLTAVNQRVPLHGGEEIQPVIDRAEADTAAPKMETEADNGNVFDIFHFPKGTVAGLCLHDMLEHFDFCQAAARQESVIADSLARYGFPAEFQAAAMQVADWVAALPMNPQVSLTHIPATARMAEMGFLMRIEEFRPRAIQRWLKHCRYPLPPSCLNAANALTFQTVSGFLNGFIDLTFLDNDGNAYVVDYKSNHLGMTADGYTADAVHEAVAHHHYYLQAFIYAVAVARYLKQRQRLPERIFVRYLFVRGLGKADHGVWSWQIDSEELAEWLD